MLEMIPVGGVTTQAWQVVNVAGSLPFNPSVGLSAWFTASSQGFGTVAGVKIWTFGLDDEWPDPSGMQSTTMTLDGASHTWAQISLAPVPIPADTEWILAEVFYVNSTMLLRNGTNGTTNGYVDDVLLTIVPEPASLSLMGLGLGGLALRRRRRM